MDGIMMSVYFNLATALWWVLDPMAFAGSYPKEIQAVFPKQKRITKTEMLFSLVVIVPVLLFGIFSAWNAGVAGFWNLFWTAYIEWMFVNFGDLIGLDLILREKMGQKMELPGTEGMEVYKREKWMKSLALPEHLLMWPLLACPFFGVISAGIRFIF